MNTLARLALPAFAVILLCGAAAEVRACSCLREASVCDAFGGSSAVFAGRVVGSAETRTETDRESGKKITFAVGTIYFAVEEAFSGVKGKRRVAVHSGTGGGDCGYWFLTGKRYLVYAGAAEDGKLYTNICTRTRPAEDAAEDFAFLRDLPREGTGVRIYGQVARPPYTQAKPEEAKPEGLPGIKITVTGPGGARRELFTDAEGRYEVTHLKPGKYKVEADLPSHYDRGERTAEELEVYDRGCASASFAAIPNGVVTGRVVTAEGEPVTEAKVVLVRADLDRPGEHEEAGVDYMKDKEGRFEIGQVPPGEYVLGVNVTWMPQPDSPYPPTYYPGTADRSGAAVIKVGLGEKVPDLLLRLPPPLAERKVHGIVVWPDGTPAAGAEVHLSDVNHPDYTATGWDHKADAQGRFTLPGLEGVTYWVHARAPKYPNKPYNESGIMHAEPPKVTLAADAYGLRLVLASDGAVCQHYAEKK